jgi:Fe-S-cluster containining protein
MEPFCNRCGKCCEAIRLPVSPQEVNETANAIRKDKSEYHEREHDWVFIDEHFSPITVDEAMRRNPIHRMYLNANPDEKKRLHFYECDQYDWATKSCKAHDSRPRLCREYPIDSTGYLHETVFYSATCDYINALPDAERGVWIEIAKELIKRGERP